MEFFKVRAFRRGRKKAGGMAETEEVKVEKAEDGRGEVDVEKDEEEEDDDDFITKEVKRRLKELRKNSFMVLIPEEACLEDEEAEEDVEEGCSESKWRDDECGLCGFDAFYETYSQRMMFFDKLSRQLLESDSSYRSPKSASKKVGLSLRNLSFKKKGEHDDEMRHLELEQPEEGPHENFEAVYVAQICLSWEALHCQHRHLSQKLSPQNGNISCCYSYACQAFQQFQVLLQRFMENEPFEDGPRAETYARARRSLPLLLQVPRYQDFDMKEKQEDSFRSPVPATDLLKIMEDAILTFHQFLKIEKNNRSLHLLGGHNQTGNMLQLLRNSLSKKETKLKELYKKMRIRQKDCSPKMGEEVNLLFALIDMKVISRVLRMDKIGKQQLLWCEEKMSKLEISENRLNRHGSPVIFPC